MKFLHLSDLHIGKNVNGFSMIPDQKHILRQILECVRTEKPTAVIIAGDVYDRAIPGVDAVRLFDDFITELAEENVAVLLVAGNHDSPERLSFANRLLTDKQIFFDGIFNGAMQKIILSDEFGSVNFWLLPFVKPSLGVGSYEDVINTALTASGINYNMRNVLISHQFYTKPNVTPIRSESELSPVGGLDAVNAGIVEKFDYVALGHLHGRQRVGERHIRYCGSPLKYSFSEIGQQKSVTVVEIKEKGELAIDSLPLIPLHDMREIKGEIDKLMSDEISSLADKEDYLRVILTNEDEIIDPMGKLRSVYPNVMSLSIENSRANIDISAIEPAIETVEQFSTYELFEEFFLTVQGTQMEEKQGEIVRNLLEKQGDVE